MKKTVGQRTAESLRLTRIQVNAWLAIIAITSITIADFIFSGGCHVAVGIGAVAYCAKAFVDNKENGG